MKNAISAIILTKNEEENIVDCLDSLDWCSERIIIDDNSGDRTKELAEKKAIIENHSLQEDFASQRNYGLTKAKGEWILFVDADERVGEELKNEIIYRISQAENKGINGYYIGRTDIMWGKALTHGESGSIKLLRLARKNSGEWEGKVHEEWKIKEPKGQLESVFTHYPHKTLEEFITEINFYTDIRAKELNEQGIKGSFLPIVLYPVGKFFVNYVLKRGFLDGVPGLLVAVLMSFHSFLVRGKLWLLQQRKSDL